MEWIKNFYEYLLKIRMKFKIYIMEIYVKFVGLIRRCLKLKLWVDEEDSEKLMVKFLNVFVYFI